MLDHQFGQTRAVDQYHLVLRTTAGELLRGYEMPAGSRVED